MNAVKYFYAAGTSGPQATPGSTETFCIGRGNVALGINDVNYGPTGTVAGVATGTDFWAAAVPAYTGQWIFIEMPRASSDLTATTQTVDNVLQYQFADPSLVAPPQIKYINSDSELVVVCTGYGYSGVPATAAGAIDWMNANTPNVVIVNRDYENIITKQLHLLLDPGFVSSVPPGVHTRIYDISGNKYPGGTNLYFSTSGLRLAGTYGTAGSSWISYGTGGYIASNPSTSGALTNGFYHGANTGITVAAWINATNLTGTSGIVGTLANPSGTSGFGLYKRQHGIEFRVAFNGAVGRNYSATSGVSGFSTNNWYYVAGVYDSSNSQLTVYTYYNSSTPTIGSATTAVVTGGQNFGGADTLYLGQFSNNLSVYSGVQSGLRSGIIQIYNRALTQAELTVNYNLQKGRYPATGI